MKPLRIASLMAAFMILMSAAVAYTQRSEPQNAPPRHVMANMIPTAFEGWQLLPSATMAVVNPQTEQLLNKLYSEVVTRTYIRSDGYRVMLSVAYGHDQRGALQAHKPEVCYPAQGFTLHSTEPTQLDTPFGQISARKLQTSLGPRKEPITYWFTMGDTAVRSKFQQRLVEVRYGLTGEIPDGILFRVSSIDDDSTRAFLQHQAFVTDLLNALAAQDRQWLAGLAG